MEGYKCCHPASDCEKQLAKVNEMTPSAVRLKNETGIVTGMMLFMLAIFTVLGVSAIVMSINEMQLASNDQFYKRKK